MTSNQLYRRGSEVFADEVDGGSLCGPGESSLVRRTSQSRLEQLILERYSSFWAAHLHPLLDLIQVQAVSTCHKVADGVSPNEGAAVAVAPTVRSNQIAMGAEVLVQLSRGPCIAVCRLVIAGVGVGGGVVSVDRQEGHDNDRAQGDKDSQACEGR